MDRLDARWLGRVDYRKTWALQRELAQARRNDEIPDTLLLLEHDPVYTLGRETKADHMGIGEERLRALGADVVEVDRGGSITFHGPGQLVAYPIVRLAALVPIASEPAHGDVVEYLRILEDALIDTVGNHGVTAGRRPPYTGVWVESGKLAAIGVKLVSGGVTIHGVALNITTDLNWFEQIIPCGIRDEGVASLESIGADCQPTQTVGNVFAGHLARRFGLEIGIALGAITPTPA